MQGDIAAANSGPKVQLTLVTYVVAVLCVVVGILLGVLLRTVLDPTAPLLLAILTAAWFAGLWPALLAAVLATFALDYFFTAPLYTFTLELAHLPHLLVFALFAAVFGSASAARRTAERSLKRAHDDMDSRVRERTADLTRANQRLATQYAVTRVLAEYDRLDRAAPQLLQIMATTMGWELGTFWQVDRADGLLRCASRWHAPYLEASDCPAEAGISFTRGQGLPGVVWESSRPHWVADVTQEASFVRRHSAARLGLHGAIAFPILVAGETVGVVEFFSRSVREPDADELDTMAAVGSQIGQFIERKRAEDERERLLAREQLAHADAVAAQSRFREQAELLNLTHDTVFVRDLNDVVTYWNRGAEVLYGWRPEEAVGKISHELTQTVFPVPLDQITAQLLRTGRWEGELVHTKRDGSQVVVASRWSLQRDANGAPVAILETNNDITKRKQAEEALRDSKEQWEAVFENNPTMYFMVDPEGTVLSVNPFGAEQLGYTADELVGQSVLRVFLPEDWDAVRQSANDCLEHLGQVMSWEMRKIRKDGTLIWVRETAKAMKRTKGGPIVLIACEDVTPRKRAEAELRESERRHRHIFQATGVSIWEEDFTQVKAAIDDLKARGVDDVREYVRTSPAFTEQAISLVRVVDVNDATLKLFGADTKEELLVSLQTIFTPQTREVFAGELVAIAEGQSAFEGETVLRTLTGDNITVLFSVSFPPPGSPFDAVLVSIMDITARKRAERELEELAGRLIHAQEQERSRIGRELHDHISQMLGVLTIKIDQLRADAATPPAVAAALDDIRRNTADVTDDVHRLSHRLHSSTLDYLGLGPALQKLVTEFAERHRIAIDLSDHGVPSALPSEVALCLFRVTEESLTNIAKHSHAVSARVAVKGQSDGIHLSIEDSGDGFDVTTLETRAGLGFVSMRERLRVLRGTVRIESAPSHGTSINVWVPASSLVPDAGMQPAHLGLSSGKRLTV